MSASKVTSSDQALDLATEILYRMLAVALSDPRDGAWRDMADEASSHIATAASDLLREEFGTQTVRLGLGELPPEDIDARPVLAELRRPRHELVQQYVRVFGLVTCRECPPYETEYHPNGDTFFRAQQMADVAGFYRAFGLLPGSDARERPDALALELEFMAFLLMKRRLAEDRSPAGADEAAVCREARAKFFRDHMIWWMPSFALGMRKKAEQGLLATAGRLLSALLPVERIRMNVEAPPIPVGPNTTERTDACEGCPAAVS